jgi:membrane protein
MINAYKNFFKGYVDFAGRSTRSEYWWVWLGNMILLIPFYSAYGNALANSRDEGALIALGGTVIIYMIIGLALFLPGLALTVRRLRDAGFHWALIFVGFVPFVGSIALLVLLAMPTKAEATPAISEAQEVRVEEAIEASPFEESDQN